MKYNSIAEAKARIDEIKALVEPLIKEAQEVRHIINNMNDCNYQNNCCNQPEAY